MILSKKTILIITAAITAAVMAFTCVSMLSAPAAMYAITAGNYSGNLMNGGKILTSNGFIFYINDKNDLIYADVTDGKNASVIMKDVQGELQYNGDLYYFTDIQNNLYSLNINSKNIDKIMEDVYYPQVVGDMLYYSDKNGGLYKKRLTENRIFDLGIKADGRFYIYIKTVYYKGGDGFIYTSGVNTGPSELIDDYRDVFIPRKSEKFFFDGRYIFYKINEGTVFSFTDDAEQTDDTKHRELKTVEDYVIKDNYILYTNGYEFVLSDINGKSDDVIIKTGAAFYLSCDDKYFYYFDEFNSLMRIDADGKNAVKMN